MKAWRDSASLILAARQIVKQNPGAHGTEYDYKLLNLKRHRNASFMPGSYVFPGGMVEPSDADLKWNQLFSSFGFGEKSFAPLFSNNSKRPPIFKPKRNQLPREISLRITAIRETFEECGILLCKKSSGRGELSDEWAQHFINEENQDVGKKWQSIVHEDATQFYNMCQDLKCYPNIWALHEWSNWLTPSIFPKRFDAAFFVSCLPSQPNVEFEKKEMEDLRWEDPKTLLSPSQGYKLEVPQYYEIARIAKYESINNLLDFAIARGKIGIHQIFPIKFKCSDGFVMVLPGDCMYPEHVNTADRQEFDKSPMTVSDFRNQSPIKNRIEFYHLEVRTLVVDSNVQSTDGHLSPLRVDTVQLKSSKY